MSRKIGEFNVTEFVNAYLVNDDIDDINRLVMSVKLNSELVLSKILRCYDERYFDRFFDLLIKLMDGVGIRNFRSDNKIMYLYGCAKFDIGIESCDYQKIITFGLIDKMSVRMVCYDGDIDYSCMNDRKIINDLTYSELMGQMEQIF